MTDKPDGAWSAYNQRLEDAIERRSWIEAATIYSDMALYVENEGKDANYLKDQEYRMKLMNHQETLRRYADGDVDAEVLCNQGACKACSAYSAKVFTTQEASMKSILPVKDCTNQLGCRCTYLPVTSYS